MMHGQMPFNYETYNWPDGHLLLRMTLVSGSLVGDGLVIGLCEFSDIICGGESYCPVSFRRTLSMQEFCSWINDKYALQF